MGLFDFKFRGVLVVVYEPELSVGGRGKHASDAGRQE